MTDTVMQYDNVLLVTREDIDRECRPCNAQNELVDRCIEEAQNLDIIPAIGADVWLRVLNMENDDEIIKKLWDGGLYEDSCGKSHIFAGLKKSLLYYAYARVVRSQGGVSTRFDYVVKSDQYSDSADLKARVQAYNEAFATADGYKVQCLQFMAENADAFGDCCKRKIVNNRIAIKKIGY